MKFDIIRAWKDEEYRQSLSQEQLEMLPASPAGELSELELAAVYGSGVGLGGSSSDVSSESIHSYSVICDINVFSLNLIVLPILSIASTTNQICANRD